MLADNVSRQPVCYWHASLRLNTSIAPVIHTGLYCTPELIDLNPAFSQRAHNVISDQQR